MVLQSRQGQHVRDALQSETVKALAALRHALLLLVFFSSSNIFS